MKTGTTSMNRALSMLGYRVSDSSWKLLSTIIHERWEEVESHANEWDALEDNPIPQVYKELDRLFPGSKFILTLRNSEDWYKSVSHHIGDMRKPMHEWVFGKGKGLPKDDKEHTIKVYENHNKKVQTYFADRPGDLYTVNLSEKASWEGLCSFLGEPEPSEPFPFANKSNFSKVKHRDTRSRTKRIKHAIFSAYYGFRDMLPTATERLND